MINTAKLDTFLSAYKAQFVANWPNERFKWQAVQHFQTHWNIDAPDFAAMFKEATDKTNNLLVSMNYFPGRMIEKFARADATTTREMFRMLYSETLPLKERVQRFMAKADELMSHFPDAKLTFQNANSISTYLWLRYPNNYYIYKYSEFLAVAHALESTFIPKRGALNNLVDGFQMYDDIRQHLLDDVELRTLLTRVFDTSSYPDTTFHTIAIDFGYFITQTMKNRLQNGEYHPGLTVENWFALLQDTAVFNESSLRLMRCFHEQGGEASTGQLEKIYGNDAMHYSATAVNLAERIITASKCKTPPEEKDSKFWPVLFTGRRDGAYFWRIRPELHEALEMYGIHRLPAELYSEKHFLSEVYLSAEQLTTCLALLTRKQNLILQGAPGVGKTYAAERLAFAMMGRKDQNRIHKIQFHQNYSYEDFVQGYRPDGSGFSLKNGSFYDFCQHAANDPEQDYFFIIDEINRGNISKIFGELLMLIESDYRGKEVTLAYSEQSFSVPSNLYIIGMMNTADRSLAMIDYALRRRFSFVELTPGFDSNGFGIYQQSLNNPAFDALVTQLKALNVAIRTDLTLGSGFCIGHSYVCGLQKDALNLSHIVEYDIIPMLKEYWFDEQATVDLWSGKLRNAVHVQ
jgi:5-methylcytosine-specific restriction protein B